MIVVQVGPFRATIEDGVWRCEDVEMQARLRAEQESFEEFEARAAYRPDPDRESADHMVEVFGGKILDLSKHVKPPETDVGEDRI